MSFAFEGRPVLVTGGAGFIGSHVVDALIGRGCEVHVVDDLSGGIKENVPTAATLHTLDIQSEAVSNLFEQHRFAAVFHLAAQMDVRKSVADPQFDARVNVLGLLNLMEAGRHSGLEKVVFASTGGAIYGEPDRAFNDAGPQPEDHPQRPLSPYGITKLVSEHYLRFYYNVHKIPYVALRFGNVYGPRQNPHGEAGVVAIFAQRMLRGEQPVINGPGTQTRDYVFVADVVNAVMAAADYDGADVFNVGTGIETDVNVLFRTISTHVGNGTPEKHGPAKAGEQQRSVLDISKSKRVLGWEPIVSVDEGLAETVDWFRSRQEALAA